MLVYDEIRLTRDAMKYGFAVGKVRVLQTRVLDAATFERLIDAPSFDEQKRILSDTPFGRYLEGTETAEEVERALDEALSHSYQFLAEAELPEAVARYFRLTYDFANLKAALKALLFGVPLEGLLLEHGTVPREAFEGDLESLPAPFGPLAATLLEDGAIRDGLDAAQLDAVVDWAYFAELIDTAKAAYSAFLLSITKASIDAANAKTLVRANRAGLAKEAIDDLLIDGGSIGSDVFISLVGASPEDVRAAFGRYPALRLLAAEDLSDISTLDVGVESMRRAAIQRGRAGDVGPEPVISYVLAREGEISSLRVLLLGKLSGLDRETIRRRLRTS